MDFKKTLKKIFPNLFSSRTHLAYGVEESPNKYPLDKVRYVMIAELLHQEYLRRGKPIRVLDIGCSEGMMILYSRKNDTQAEFYGIDILEERKKKAIERGYKDVWLEDIRECDFGKYRDRFDAVICSHILEHLERPGDLLQKLNSVMSEDGLLIIGTPIGLLPGVLWRKYISPLCRPWYEREAVLKRFGHVSFFTLSALKKLLLKSGFRAEECRGEYLIRARGFFLEDCKWWFDFNQWYGRLFPGVLGYVVVKARKERA